MDGDTERMLKPDLIAVAVLIAKLEEVTTRNRRHCVYRRQRYGSNRVRLGIGDKQLVAGNSETRGLREGRLINLPVTSHLLACARVRIRAIVQQIDHPDLM